MLKRLALATLLLLAALPHMAKAQDMSTFITTVVIPVTIAAAAAETPEELLARCQKQGSTSQQCTEALYNQQTEMATKLFAANPLEALDTTLDQCRRIKSLTDDICVNAQTVRKGELAYSLFLKDAKDLAAGQQACLKDARFNAAACDVAQDIHAHKRISTYAGIGLVVLVVALIIAGLFL